MQKSLAKALEIIKFLSGPKAEYGISEISKEMSLYKSNVHEILNTFEAFGYVRQNEETRKYSLSFRFLEIAHLISTRMGVSDVIRFELQQACDTLGEVTYFGIPDRNKVMYLDGAFPKNNMAAKSVIGMTAPAYCTGIGKAMLAFMDEDTVAEFLNQPMERYTDHTIVDPEKLQEVLNEIKQVGYAIDNMEHEYGVKCVAVPVFTMQRQLLGAVSVTGPSLRFPKSVYARYAEVLKEVAYNIGKSSTI